MAQDADVAVEEEVQQAEVDAEAEGAEQSGTEPEQTEAESSPAESEPPKPKGVGKRLDELTRNWRESEREAAYWKQLATQRQTQEAPKEESLKTLEDFGFDDKKYQAYLIPELERRAVSAAQRYAKEEAQRSEAERSRLAYSIKETDYAKGVEDYYEVTRNPRLDVNDTMAEVISTSEEGPALAYHLGKNPDIASRISSLSPLAAARELGRLESKLVAEREALRRKVSAAPPPPKKIEGASPKVEKSDDDLTNEEWNRRENQREAKKRGNA